MADGASINDKAYKYPVRFQGPLFDLDRYDLYLALYGRSRIVD
jgi:hypothetical protein